MTHDDASSISAFDASSEIELEGRKTTTIVKRDNNNNQEKKFFDKNIRLKIVRGA